MEWHNLNTLDVTSWDTPELVKSRNACNQEIQSILQERDRIDSALQALTRADVTSIDFDQLEADRKRIERDRLHVLQRELKLRQTQLKPLAAASRKAASAAYDKLHSEMPEIEARIVKRLESIGFTKPANSPAAGNWNRGMITGHPEHLATTQMMSQQRTGIGHSPSDTENQEAIERIQATLSKALAAVAA